MDMVKKPRKKNKAKRKVRMVSYSDDIKKIYNGFIKILQTHLVFGDDRSQFTGMINTFFGTDYRQVYFCRAVSSFSMPGLITTATKKIKRDVRINDTVIIRYDTRTPEVNEVEFAGLNFKLSESQRNLVLEKMKVIC